MKKLVGLLGMIIAFFFIGTISADAKEAVIGDAASSDGMTAVPFSGGVLDTEMMTLDFSGVSYYDLAYDVLEIVNQERGKVGLNALTMDKTLQNAAMERAAEVAVDFKHTRPNGEYYPTILPKYSYAGTVTGENIAAPYINAASTMNQWMNSSLHRSNILSTRQKSIGVGVFKQKDHNCYFWVQMFSSTEVADHKQTNQQEVEYSISMPKNKEIGFLGYNKTVNHRVEIGESKVFRIGVKNDGWDEVLAFIEPTNIDWHTDDSAKAAVDSSGVVAGKSVGVTKLTGKLKNYPEFVDSLNIEVPRIRVTSVTINEGETSMTVGDTRTFSATVLPGTATDKSLTWTSENESVATVAADGKVTAHKAGTARIRVRSVDNGAQDDSVLVTVVNPATVNVTGVTVSPTSVDLTVGGTRTLTPTVAPSNATDKTVTWKSSNTAVATVDASGKVAGVGAGTATITVTTNNGGKTATTSVKVTAPTISVTGVTVSPTSVGLSVGGFHVLSPTVSPSNAANKTVTWKSSNEAVAKVDTSGKVTGVGAGTATITATTQDGGKTATAAITVSDPSVLYRTHVQTVGWQGNVSNGATSGTTGRALRLEGINVSLANLKGLTGGIEYRTHIQKNGWETNYASNGAMSGTSGKALRLEAIQIRLTGEIANHYDVYYRVHAQTFGWMDWAKNGASAGTAGYAYRLEGIQIKLVKKGGSAPGATTTPFKAKPTSVNYRTHVQKVGWQNYVSDGAMSGTTGKALRLEGINIQLSNQEYAGNIEYRTHVQKIGWETNYAKNGAMSGTSGRALRLEAIQIRLTGEMANRYDIYYRVHSQTFGWLDWAKNGASAGTAGYAYRLESIQIKLVQKGGSAPGATSTPFRSK